MKVILAIDGASPDEKVVKAYSDSALAFGFVFLRAERFESGSVRRIPLLLDRAKAHLRQHMEDAAGRLQGIGGNVTTEIVMGSPRRAINTFAGDWHADLVMVGSSTLRPWERRLIGSIPRSSSRHGPCSVEVVRPERENTNVDPKPHMKILVGTDGSKFSTAALRSVAARPWPSGSKVKIISVPEFPLSEEISYLNAREAEDLRVACEEEAILCAAEGVAILAG